MPGALQRFAHRKELVQEESNAIGTAHFRLHLLSPSVQTELRAGMNRAAAGKHPLKLKDIWAIRIPLQIAKNARELGLFNLAIWGKLRGCDLVQLRVNDVAPGRLIATRTVIRQQEANPPVQCEFAEQTEI